MTLLHWLPLVIGLAHHIPVLPATLAEVQLGRVSYGNSIFPPPQGAPPAASAGGIVFGTAAGTGVVLGGLVELELVELGSATAVGSGTGVVLLVVLGNGIAAVQFGLGAECFVLQSTGKGAVAVVWEFLVEQGS